MTGSPTWGPPPPRAGRVTDCRDRPRRTRVAVVFGGRSTEHAISCGQRRQRPRRARPDAYEVVPVGITREGRWVLTGGDPEVLRDRAAGSCPRPWPVRHRGGAAGRPDRRRSAWWSSRAPGRGRAARRGRGLPGAARRRTARTAPSRACSRWPACPTSAPACWPARRPWTRSSPRSCCAAEGLPVGPYAVAPAPAGTLTAADRDRLGLPVFVKPARAGSSASASPR